MNLGFRFALFLAMVVASATASGASRRVLLTTTEAPVKLVVTNAAGQPIGQWTNPSANVHVLVQVVLPTSNAKSTAVVVIPGSGGGLPTAAAQAYAERGYPAMAVQYFDYNPNSDYVFSITQLPLETFETAIKWLRARSDIPIQKIVLHGRSRGGEAALLVGEHFPNLLSGIVAEVPSTYAWGDRANGIWSQYIALQPNPAHETSSWTHNGQAVAFVKMQGWLQTYSKEVEYNHLPLYSYTDAYKKALRLGSRSDLEAARIKVENIKAPIMVTGGTEDQLWPSADSVQKIQNYRRQADAEARAKDIYMVATNAGHIWDASITEPLFFPSGVYDLAKPDFSNICAESDLRGYLEALTPMPNPTPTAPGQAKGFPYSGHIDEILSMCSQPNAQLYYYMAPEYAANGGDPKVNGRWGEKAVEKVGEFLDRL